MFQNGTGICKIVSFFLALCNTSVLSPFSYLMMEADPAFETRFFCAVNDVQSPGKTVLQITMLRLQKSSDFFCVATLAIPVR
jgi:hypothetical protein